MSEIFLVAKGRGPVCFKLGSTLLGTSVATDLHAPELDDERVAERLRTSEGGVNMKIGILLLAGSILAVAHLGGCDRSPDERGKGGSGAPVTSAPPPSEPAARPSNPMAAQTIDDASITTKVRAALIADTAIKSTDIDVDTEQGTVTLTGRVPDAAQVERAAQIARGVEGVKEVSNKLTNGAS